MVVFCQAENCRKRAPDKLQWKLVMACKVTDVFDLFLGEFDALDCPNCGATASITPSLVGLFIVDDRLLILDRGFDPEERGREAVAALVWGLGCSLAPEHVSDLNHFKSVFAAKIKATARRYPFQSFDPSSAQDNLANWKELQGEIMSSLFAGASGVVPGLGIHTRELDGSINDQEHTIEVMKDLILHLMTSWSLGLSALTKEIPLEAFLLRLIDSCGSVAFISDQLIERLAELRKFVEDEKIDRWMRFHFKAVEASLFAMLGEDNPNAGAWASEYLMVRCAAHRGGEGASGRFLLSPKRIRSTISYEHAWNAVARILASLVTVEDEKERSKEMKALELAIDELGHGDLLNAVMKEGLRISVVSEKRGGAEATDRTPEELAKFVRAQHSKNPDLPWSALIHVWQPSWYSDASEIAHLFDLLKPELESASERADLLTWLGERLKLLGAPELALERIGRDPAPWEETLNKHDKRCLWTERSNALRLAGERTRALDVARATLAVTLSDADAPDQHKATALLNVGILLRETGQFREAVGFIQTALELAPQEGRWYALQSLAATFAQMGRIAEAADVFAEARKTAGGIDTRGARAALLVSEITARMYLRQFKRADELLRRVPSLDEVPDAALPGLSGIMRATAIRKGDIESSRDSAIQLVDRLKRSAEAFAAAGNQLQAQSVWHAAAVLAHDFGLPEAESLWLKDAQASALIGRWPPTRTAIEMAILEIERDPGQFVEMLDAIIAALAQQAGGIAVDALTMDLLSPLEGPFERLAATVFEKGLGPNADQLVAEVRRNAHHRAQMKFEGDESAVGFRSAAAEAMSPDQATFMVLEWCDLRDDDMIGLVSLLKPGDASVGYLYYTQDIDIVGTADLIGARMPKWRNSRAGEPFDVPGWDNVRHWLRLVAENYLPGGGHVVIIDHPQLTPLPFHIALSPEWTVSYASDWLAIEAAVAANGRAAKSPRLGVLHAPRSNETIAVREALETSARAAEQLAIRYGLASDRNEPGGGDAATLSNMLATANVLKVLCHGQVWKEDREVALLVDHEGRPPPGYTLSALVASNRAHRFGRAALKNQSVAPRTVFLGACSSGVVSIGGLDERTSFATLLSHAGTSAVVAPRWKIDAEMALPVLDEAMAGFVAGKPLNKAVGGAAAAAINRGVPAWQAHAFVIEGAWE